MFASFSTLLGSGPIRGGFPPDGSKVTWCLETIFTSLLVKNLIIDHVTPRLWTPEQQFQV